MPNLRRKSFLIFALVLNLIAALLAIAFQGDLRERLGVYYWLVVLVIGGCALLVVSGYVWDQTLLVRLRALLAKAGAVPLPEDDVPHGIDAPDSSPDEIIGLARQIERMARSLRKAEASYRGIVEDQFDLICRYRPDGVLTFANGAFCRFFGKPRSELLGQPFPALVAVPPKPWRDDSAVTTFEQEVTLTGRGTWLHWFVRSIFDDEDRLVEYQAVGHDVTDRKRAEVALLRAKETAEAANRTKGELLATVSHEIRTPIGGILGFARLLDETTLTEEQREYVELIRKSGDALLVLINDLLDFSKIEAGRIEIAADPFSPKRCLLEVMEFFSPRAAAAGLSFESSAAEDLPASVTGDAYRLRQVLINLVDNAIKFTKKGGVSIRLGVGPVEGVAHALMLRFVVSDTGVGIASDKIGQLFKPFSQADAAARRLGGSGLGLLISKRLCELMGGKIWVESMPARGSTFHFIVRVGKAAAATA